jgi:hypothetical protein
MSAKHIDNLPAAAAPDGSELLHVLQGGNSRKLTVAAIVALALGGGATAELIRDTMGAALLQAAGITITVNDPGDTITIAADVEAIQDVVGALIGAGTGVNGGIVVNYNDAGNAESISLASSAFLALVDGANIPWDMSAGYNASVTLGGARTLSAPTNPVEGRTYSLAIKQDGTGNRTLALPASFKFGSAGAPTLSTAAGKEDMIYLQCRDSVTPIFRCSFSKDA